jgi:hypothetical protein
LEFATSGLFADLDSGMTRFLSGRADCGALRVKQPLTDTDLVFAMTHLRASVVGVVANLDRFVSVLAESESWRVTEHERRMVGAPYRKATAAERAAIAEYNRFDMALYEYALEVAA